MTITDRVAVITGGRRIGRVVAQWLAARGADIVLSYRGSRAEAEQTQADVIGAGRRAVTVQADVATGAGAAALIEAADRTFGRLDILINMASVYRTRTLDAMTETDWDLDLGANLKSAFLCSHAAIPLLRRAGTGRIVNFTDWLAASGRPAYPGFLSYFVAKRGVMALTEALALELASDNILVNAIAPGPIVAPPDLTATEAAEVAAATPLGRWGGEEEIAKAVVALIESDFITGETIRVDGGRHVR
jgi:NAD(P)-dependent dehydrogenase (short-subunit alcohol dehydrogenase family)